MIMYTLFLNKTILDKIPMGTQLVFSEIVIFLILSIIYSCKYYIEK